MLKKVFVTLLAAAVGPFAANQSLAGVSTATIDVTAFVGSACIVSTTPLVFHVMDPMIPDPTMANANITVTCNPDVTFEIALDGGLNSDGTTRRVSDGLGHYGYYDLGNVTIGWWGDNGFTSPYPTYFGVASGGTDVITVDGFFQPSQPLPNGVYYDVVTVTVSY